MFVCNIFVSTPYIQHSFTDFHETWLNYFANWNDVQKAWLSFLAEVKYHTWRSNVWACALRLLHVTHTPWRIFMKLATNILLTETMCKTCYTNSSNLIRNRVWDSIFNIWKMMIKWLVNVLFHYVSLLTRRNTEVILEYTV